MNERQKKIIAKITEKEEPVILNELLEFFFDKGLGSVNKSETDIFLFYLLEKISKKQGLNFSNFEWSSLLKISERKIKNLRLEVGIRYSSDGTEHEFDLCIGLLDLITEGYLEFDETDKVILTIENPNLLRYIQHKLKELRLPSADYSFNAERVKFNLKSLETLLKETNKFLKTDRTFAQRKLKNAKWTNYGKEAGKKIFGVLTSAVPDLMIGIPNPFSK